MPAETRRLATILFCDVVGFSRKMGRDETSTLALIREFEKLCGECSQAHGGRIVKWIGDCAMVEFPVASEAVACGLEIQARIASRNSQRPKEDRMATRIGIHLGEIVVQEDGDVLGDPVNVAARLQPLAPPGGLAVSEEVWDQVQNKFQGRAKSLGTKYLKNIQHPVRVLHLFPPKETSRLTRILQTAAAGALALAAGGLAWMGLQPAPVPPAAPGAAFLGIWPGEPDLAAEAHRLDWDLRPALHRLEGLAWLSPEEMEKISLCSATTAPLDLALHPPDCPECPRSRLRVAVEGKLEKGREGLRLTLRTIRAWQGNASDQVWNIESPAGRAGLVLASYDRLAEWSRTR